ncbi:Coiled-coil and C2 domain-containing protein 2A [Sparganum proliferum]
MDSQSHDLVWGRDRWPMPFERIEAESHLLFSPSGLEVPLEVKTHGRSVRYAEDEGLYVGQLPFVAPANIRRLENRILREAEYQSGTLATEERPYTHDGISQWFTEDGRMKMATSPLRDVLFRPLQSMTFFNNAPEEFNYIFLPPLSDQEMRSLEQSYSRVNNPVQRTFQLPFRRSNGVGTTPVDFQQIEIELASVGFSFHPLFLAEHVFAHNLRMLVKALEDMVGRDHINACIQRASQEHEDEESGLSARICQYQSEIDTLRRARNRVEGFERGLLTSILRCWKRIKDTREEQGFISTTVGLKIIKENIDAAADDFAWKKEIAELTEEARKKHEMRRKRLMTEYETALAVHQAKLREEAAEGGEKRTSLTKPEPPAEFDAVAARKAIVNELATYRRKPGESEISVILNESVDITPELECPRSEQERRKAMNSFTYFAKLFYNGKFVETTPHLCLDDKFTLRFGQVYPLQVCEPPDDISATIYEKHGCVIKRIAEVHLDKATLLTLNRCPSSSASHPSVSLAFGVLNPSSVSTGLCAGMSPHKVMAGVEFVLESLEGSGETVVRLVPNGSVTLGVKWRVAGDATCTTERTDRGSRAPELGAGSQADPNDPNYIKMLKTAQGPFGTEARGDLDADVSAQTRAIGLSYFRLNPHLQQFCFCTDEELDLSRRFRLLQLRNSGHRDFQNLTVPLNSREVPAGIFETLEPAKEKTTKARTKGLEQHFSERKKYLQEIGKEVLKRFEASIKRKTLSDVVAEEEIPNLTALLPLLTEFLRPRRPLNPNRKEMKKTSIQNIKETGVVLVVTIGDAKNLPVRVVEQAGRTTARPAESPLRPVIEVRFQDFVQTTPVGEGCNPSWNSEFRILYKYVCDFFV